MKIFPYLILLTLPFLASCSTTSMPDLPDLPEALTLAPRVKYQGNKYRIKDTQRGEMSWYSVRTNHGTATASGERLSDNGFTAAHRNIPFGSLVRVTNLRNGKSTILRINDRGPHVRGRILDVSVGAAEDSYLGFRRNGVAPCKVEVLEKLPHSFLSLP